MKFVLPGLPPSINSSHFRARQLKPETSRWILNAGLMMRGQMHGQRRIEYSADLLLTIRLYGKWNTSNGKRRADLSNRIKILEDTVAKVCGFDDSAVFAIDARKVPAVDERTEVEVRECAP